MRILFLGTNYPCSVSPSRGIYNYRLLDQLSANHAVCAIAPRTWLERFHYPSEALARRGQSPIDTHFPVCFTPPGMMRHRHHDFIWGTAGSAIRRTVREFRPDCVMSYWAHPDGAVAQRAADFAGVPHVAMSGGSDVLVKASSPKKNAAVLDVLRRAAAVVAVSEDIRSRISDLGIDAAKLHVSRRGVDLDSFQPGDRVETRRLLRVSPERPLLVWVGRMEPVKGLNVLLDALFLLRERGRECDLRLIGDGSLRTYLESRTATLDLGKNVTFVGPLKHDALADWYRAADLSVLPSKSEGVPNVLLESIACGTSFVASRVGGIPEIADEAWDRLVPAGEPHALAAAIAERLQTPVPATPRRFLPQTWAQSAAHLESILASVVGR